jgi:hypothetical protein
LVDSAFVGNQVSGDQLLAGSLQFVGKTDLQQLRQTRVGIKADAILIGDRYQHEVEQLLQAGQALIESFPQKAVINPTERTANGTPPIWPRRLRSGLPHCSLDEFKVEERVGVGYRILWDLPRYFPATL